MDGVLADLDTGVYNMDGFRPSTGSRDALFKRELPKYVEKDGFYTSPVMPGARDLVDLVLGHTSDRIKVGILTSAGNFYNPISEVISQKKRWIEKNFPELDRVLFCCTTSGADKSFLANSSTLLIDDHLPNIEKFQAAGGWGYHYDENLDKGLKTLLHVFANP